MPKNEPNTVDDVVRALAHELKVKLKRERLAEMGDVALDKGTDDDDDSRTFEVMLTDLARDTANELWPGEPTEEAVRRFANAVAPGYWVLAKKAVQWRITARRKAMTTLRRMKQEDFNRFSNLERRDLEKLANILLSAVDLAVPLRPE